MHDTATIASSFSPERLHTHVRGLSPAQATLLLILIASIVRVAVAGQTGLGTDESYTAANARMLALSYVDYPPLHLWVVHAWSWLCGSDAPGVLRLPFIAFFAGSTWLMFRLTAVLYSERAGFWAALALNIAPVFALPHASWILPDGPLIFFDLASVYCIARLLFGAAEPSASVKGWAIAGILSGCALLSKYHGAFVPLAVFLYVLSVPRSRGLLSTAAPWLAALLALLVFAPVLLWNSEHHWIGLFFQGGRLTGHSINPARLIGSIGGQMGYLAPWIFAPLAWVLWRALRVGPRDERGWYLALLACGPIAFFTLATVLGPGLPHWTMPGWLFAFPLLGVALARFEVRNPALSHGAAATAAGIILLTAGLLTVQARTGVFTNDLPPAAATKDPTLDLLSWNGLAPALAHAGQETNDVSAIAATKWLDAGKLNYAFGASVPVFCLCTDPQEFRYLHDAKAFKGKTMLIATRGSNPANVAAALKPWFDQVHQLRPISLMRGGKAAITLLAFRGVGFHPRGLEQ